MLPAAGTASRATLGHASGGAASMLEVPAGACRSPGSWLPREVLAPCPLAGACSYFRKPPGNGRARRLCWSRCSAPIHWEKGKSRAQPGLTYPAQHRSPTREPKLGAPKPLTAMAELPQTRPSQPFKEDTHRVHPASTQGTKVIPDTGKCRAALSIPRHTACKDRGSGTAPVPRKTWLCPHTTLPTQSRRA